MTGEQSGFDERDDLAIAALGGMNEGEVDGQGEGSLLGAVAEDEFAEDDRVTEGLFRVIIGRRHPVDIEESKEPEVIAFWVQKSLAEVFSIRVMAWGFADAVKGSVKGGDFRLCPGRDREDLGDWV